MANKKHQIVVVGGGAGGLMVASKFLRTRKTLDIAVIEPSETHAYQPLWTLVGAGNMKMAKTIRPEAKYMPKNATWIKDSVTEMNPDSNSVTLASGEVIEYDYLVVTPGLRNRPELLEGLVETLGKNNVCSNYVDPEYTWEVLKNFKGGNALFTHAPSVLKCPGAPQKIMYLTSDYLKKKAMMNNGSKVIYAFPGGVVFGVEPFKARLYAICDERGIVLKHGYQLVKVDGPNKKAYFKRALEQNGDGGPVSMHDDKNEIKEQIEGEDTYVIDFEMLHLAPHQTAMEFVEKSKLAHQEGPDKGWMNVDHKTMQNPDYANCFGVGDSVALPTAKTGAAIRKQAPVVVDNVLALMDGKSITDHYYNGYSSCPLVVSYNRMLLAEFGYGGKRMSDPMLSKFVDTGKEKWSMWILKKYGLPFLYWNMMLRGKMMD